MKFLSYHPEPAYLLPPSVHDVLGEDPVCCWLPRTVERLDLGAFEQGEVEEGRPGDPPARRRKVWLKSLCENHLDRPRIMRLKEAR
ncbi:MAG: hypothetical protein HY648_10715 [Acidobacteria bacterium]|nr:hypothetical protein [Acidobacteriota bacterium]